VTRDSTLVAALRALTGRELVDGAIPGEVSAHDWSTLAARIPATPDWVLVDLWGEPGRVHLAVGDLKAGVIGRVALACPDGTFPSVGRWHPAAIRLERTLRDLYGIAPRGAPDERHWLDHGRWPHSPASAAEPYRFHASEGEALHEIAVGPVHAGIIEPGHFRFTAAGETIVRLEERLGYVHKGVDALMRGADLERAARLSARLSGDSTVASSFAFARAVESALGVGVPPRAEVVRGVMAELERIANHLGDFGAICNDAAFAILHAHCGVLRERVLKACQVAFGHRLMMDRVVPGGVAVDLAEPGIAAIRDALEEVRARLPALVELYDNTASLQDRTAGTGVLKPELANRFGAGGYVGRASGRAIDARKAFAYPPYTDRNFAIAVRERGDVDARVWVRIEEIRTSMALLESWLGELPEGPSRAPLPTPDRGREGFALVEAFRGDLFAWVRVAADGRVEAARLRDPSWFQWPLLEAVVEGNIVADFPLCNKSFNCSYSGCDL
jgi:Ni,Fe-hydrogenase III large subunit